MRFGVSFSLALAHQVKLAKRAGFDYVECSFQELARGDEEKRSAFCAALRENDIACEAANCFLPADLPIIGTDYARREMKEYIETGMRRGSAMGMKTVVFGSGGARRLPENVGFSAGFQQLSAFLRDEVSPIALEYGVTVVIEPLRKSECNMIHTLDEGAMLASSVDRPNVSCLADVYHMWGAGETFEDIRKLRGCILHGHVSDPETPDFHAKRTFPKKADGFDYRGFVQALHDAGCPRCSIEAHCYDFSSEIQEAGEVLRGLKIV